MRRFASGGNWDCFRVGRQRGEIRERGLRRSVRGVGDGVSPGLAIEGALPVVAPWAFSRIECRTKRKTDMPETVSQFETGTVPTIAQLIQMAAAHCLRVWPFRIQVA